MQPLNIINVQPLNTIAEIRATHANLTKVGDRFPVIVLTVYSAKQQIYGVQFWTTQMISQGSQINTDKTISKFFQFL